MNDSDDIAVQFKKAVEYHSLGRLGDALTRYDSVIRLNPNIAAAHFNRGSALYSLKKFDEALQSYDRVIKLKPDHAEAHYNRGVTLDGLKRLEEALQSYDRATQLNPDYVEAYVNRGNALKELRRFEEALQSYDRAIKLKPDCAEAYYNRGNVLKELKHLDEALQSYDRAIKFKPDYVEAYINRSNALKELKRLDEALQNYDRVIKLTPGFAEAYYNKGATLHGLERMDEALQSYDRAIMLKPDYAEAYNNRGATLHDLERLDEALRSYDRAIILKPDYAEAYNNRGNTLKDLKRLNEALQSYDQALKLKPDYADAYWDKSLCTLLMQRFDEGWRLYEWRKRRSEPVAFRTYSQPAWLGKEDIEGRTLFIYAEQGLGDTIQFCRYVALAEARGANVILSTQDALRRLLKELSPTVKIIDSKTPPDYFDYHIPLLSMPLAFKTDQSSFPVKAPYLLAEPERVRKWKDKIGNRGFKIGICWQGAKAGTIDIGRSFPVSYFEDISKIPNVRLISLQKNAGVEQLLDLPAGMNVESLGDDFDAGPDAFIDTAAVMESLDLIVTSDTAVAHLAGALGHPTWVALKYVPDWRWLLDRSDSPWYPTMRLFRQPSHGSWLSVFAEMEAQTHSLVQ